MQAQSHLRILFISRAYPPVTGGIEKQNFEIHKALSRLSTLTLIANRRGKRFLPLFLPFALWKLWRLRGDYDAVLLGDGVLAVLAWALKRVSRKPVVCILHGLDITYTNPVYRRLWLGRFLHSPDCYIAVGNETIRRARELGLPADRFRFIPNGVDSSEPDATPEMIDWPGLPPGAPILLTLGRLVRRKGVAWFIREVMPRLDSNINYLVAGDGPEREAIAEAIAGGGLEQRVHLLGPVDDEQKAQLLGVANLFVQPNIPVDGDMEGFGLVVLEAARANTFVVAADLEGLRDAIVEGENGTLVASEDAAAFAERINALLEDPAELAGKGARAGAYVRAHFGWERIAAQYLAVLQDCDTAAGITT